MDKTNHSKREIRNWTYFTIGLLASWFLAFLFFTMPFGLIIWLVCLILLFRNRSKLSWLLIIFSGWVGIYMISFGFGVRDYFAGHATFIGVGLPGPEMRNLDRTYRIPSGSSGCIFVGFEIIAHPARNFAVKTCVSLFGYQKGSYTGYYPTREEVENKITQAKDTVEYSLDRSTIKFNFNNKQYAVEGGWGRSTRVPDSSFYAKVTIMNEEVLIFKPLYSNRDYDKFTMVADEKNQKPFAWFYEYGRR